MLRQGTVLSLSDRFDAFPDDDGTAAFAIRKNIFDAGMDHLAPSERQDVPWRVFFTDDRCGIFLTFGQSNAANAGEVRYQAQREVYSLNFLDMRCHPASDPLPGSGGQAGSVWTRLGDLLIEAGLFSRVLFVPIALGGTHIVEWLPGGLCHRRTALALSRLRKALGAPALNFSAALWAQGEADAHNTRMSTLTYRTYLNELITDLREQGLFGPVLVSRSTRGPDSLASVWNGPAIQLAQELIVDESAGIFAGPDTDALIGDDRFEGYHFSASGLQKAAELWLRRLQEIAWALK
jgi:hypothetical protein